MKFHLSSILRFSTVLCVFWFLTQGYAPGAGTAIDSALYSKRLLDWGGMDQQKTWSLPTPGWTLLAEEGQKKLVWKGHAVKENRPLNSISWPVNPGDYIAFSARISSTTRQGSPLRMVLEKHAGNAWIPFSETLLREENIQGAYISETHESEVPLHRVRGKAFVPPGASAIRLSLQVPQNADKDALWTIQDVYCEQTSFTVFLQNKTPETPSPPDIVLIVVDALSTRYIGCYGSANATPVMDKIASEGGMFRFAGTPAPWTKPSLVSLFTSRYPSQHGVQYWNDRLPEELDTLAESLREIGYFSAAFVRSPEGFICDAIGFAQGFDIYYTCVNEDNVHQAVLNFIGYHQDLLSNKTGAPLFLLIHMFDPHEPYTNRSHETIINTGALGNINVDLSALVDHFFQLPLYSQILSVPLILDRVHRIEKQKAGPEDLLYLRQCYASEVTFCDMRIGKVFDLLKATELYENMNIVITADHGQSFGERPGAWMHPNPYLTCTLIPFIYRFPEHNHILRQLKEEKVSSLDIMPTLIGLAGGTIPAASVGRNLLLKKADDANTVLICEGGLDPWISCFDGRYRLIQSAHGSRLFDIQNDPDEKTCVLLDFPDIARSLSNHIARHLQMVGSGATYESTGETLPPETVEVLRAHGYLF